MSANPVQHINTVFWKFDYLGLHECMRQSYTYTATELFISQIFAILFDRFLYAHFIPMKCRWPPPLVFISNSAIILIPIRIMRIDFKISRSTSLRHLYSALKWIYISIRYILYNVQLKVDVITNECLVHDERPRNMGEIGNCVLIDLWESQSQLVNCLVIRLLHLYSFSLLLYFHRRDII